MTFAVAIIAVVCVTMATAWVVSVVFRDGRSRERAWEKKETAWALERQQLLDRIMYLADHPWQMPEPQEEEIIVPEPYYDVLQEPIESDPMLSETYYPMGRV